MFILSTSDKDIEIAAQAIREGKLVAFPTETVYGLGANVWNETALANIFKAKKRPKFDPLIVHVSSIEMASTFSDTSVPYAKELAKLFWPGPLTLVLPKHKDVPDLATSGLSTVAVRCPNNYIAQALIKNSNVPIAAPSANLFGHLSPTKAEHVAAQLGNEVDYIINGGACNVGIESTVLDLTSTKPIVLRPGGLPIEEIAKVIPGLELINRSMENPKSPGQLKNHYAPKTPLYLVEVGSLAEIIPRHNAVALCFGKMQKEIISGINSSTNPWTKIVDISPDQSLEEAAAKLFDTLYNLDQEGYSEIWVEKFPEEGLGLGINDRLFKASTKN